MKQWKIKKVKLSDVRMRDDNPRSISDKAMSGLKQSISRFGYVEPIVWNKRTGNIVGGHQRYVVLAHEGITEAMMVVVDMSEEDELSANLTLNNTEIEGEWDDKITDILHQIETNNRDVFSSLNMDDLMASVEKTPRIEVAVPIDEMHKSEGDTTCPCCGHKWNVEAKDIETNHA